MYLPIPEASGEPLYIRLYRSIRGDCLSGVLRAGDRLPSRRSLARELHVSVNTVDGAYQQLVSEGYVEALPRSGYVVRTLFEGGARDFRIEFSGPGKAAETSPGNAYAETWKAAETSPGNAYAETWKAAEASPGNAYAETWKAAEPRYGSPDTPAEMPEIDRSGEPRADGADRAELIDFSPNGVDLSALPLGDLRKLMREVFASDPTVVFGPCAPEGHVFLRKALCRYLASSRGILCSPDRIVVGAGTDYILQYLIRLLRLAGPIDGIATENPVYNKAVQIFSSMGESVTPLPIDGQGLRTEALRDCRANVAYVTPSHQFPLGIVMPAGRRAELLAWAAAAPGRYVIEDDYDSEFRYEGRPVPPLFAMSKSDKVIYLGTFSKSIAPSMRISYLVLPERLAGICRREMAYFNTTVSVPDQIILARFIESGLFERHINRMRTLYRRKKDLLSKELAFFGDALGISGTDAGLHLICTVRSGSGVLLRNRPSEKDLVAAAAAVGVRVYGISGYFLERDIGERSETGTADSDFRIPESTILLGYGGLDTDALARGCVLLKDAWFR